jgi:hypothetical protein
MNTYENGRVRKLAIDERYNLSSSVLVVCKNEDPSLRDSFRKNKKHNRE